MGKIYLGRKYIIVYDSLDLMTSMLLCNIRVDNKKAEGIVDCDFIPTFRMYFMNNCCSQETSETKDLYYYSARLFSFVFFEDQVILGYKESD
ncbi:hypothetical protein FUAX_53640 (plasmid) [Fulvitalea axinellae]|uniref:Uncharacterized protein n=1 Tax=Fulvitalea axinellae TaxID=1182444 RepID=A0AAU9D1B2_9BACT|nr:hypothetical protein FUAX_53640 [Fulvitalea axinellae]